ncbi:hypothetical protein [Streptomyces sp. NPDC059371]|uniref:hypothetical protein n=1 Tax=Streptomyces sp. NPDC059371 TaxID=3346812 RepID=UPI0036A4BC1D
MGLQRAPVVAAPPAPVGARPGRGGASGAPARRGEVVRQAQALAGGDGLGSAGQRGGLGRGEAVVEGLQFGVGEVGTR